MKAINLFMGVVLINYVAADLAKEIAKPANGTKGLFDLYEDMIMGLATGFTGTDVRATWAACYSGVPEIRDELNEIMAQLDFKDIWNVSKDMEVAENSW